MKNLENRTIADIVVENINTAKVFEKYNIDFGFKGDMSLKKACESYAIDCNSILDDLNSVEKKRFYLKDYNSWTLSLLINFLKDIQHQKKKEDIFLIQKLNNDISTRYPEPAEIVAHNNLIQVVTEQLIQKMHIEENKTYPYIKTLVSIDQNEIPNTIEVPFLLENIDKIENERLQICKNLEEIIKVTNNFELPEVDDDNVKLFYLRLKRFNLFLQEHNHIEKNILLPKAIKLEQKLLNS